MNLSSGECPRYADGRHIINERPAMTDQKTGHVTRSHLSCLCGHVVPEGSREEAEALAAIAATAAARSLHWGVERGAQQMAMGL